MNISSLNLPSHGVVAVTDTQWGDTGKGKIVDLLTEWADITARGTGGANAGHTIVVGDTTHIFHLVPSGILWDVSGKINIIGSGVAFDPFVMCEELSVLDELGVSHDHVRIAYNSHLVLPQHIVLDRVKEATAGEGKIGTTGRGIGPVYTDFVARRGLRVGDMLNSDEFRKKLEANLEEAVRLLSTYDAEVIKEIMQHEHLDSGALWDSEKIFNTDAIIAKYTAYGEKLRSKIADTDTFLRKAVKEGNKKILLEGAQGTLLSIDHGVYPKVTSSDSALAGLAKGVGLSERDVTVAFGIVKAPYMTRVGEGVFPTELGQPNDADYENASINSDDPLEQCVAIRKAGHEFGATTGRPRRIGWLDLPILRYALQFGADKLILTKMDVLNACKTIKICTAYTYTGPDYSFGENVLKKGDTVDIAFPDDAVMSHMEPVYVEMNGWESDISAARTKEELPEKLMEIVRFIEKEAGVPVAIVSVGPDREETVIV